MDARARRRQRTHARASLVHRAYFFINASARARRSPADAISSVRPFVRSFVRAFPRVVRVRSRALLLESRSRVTTDALERRERARARAATTNDDRPTDRRPTTDRRVESARCPNIRTCTVLSKRPSTHIVYTRHTWAYTHSTTVPEPIAHALEPSSRKVSINLSIESIVDTHTHARDGVHVFRAIRDSLPRRRSSTRAETSRSRLVRRDARRGGDRGERDRAGLDRGANDLRVHRA